MQITSPASKVNTFNFPNMGGEVLLKLAHANFIILIFLLLMYFLRPCTHYTHCLVYITVIVLSLEMQLFGDSLNMLVLFTYYIIIIYLHKWQKELCIYITVIPFLWKKSIHDEKYHHTSWQYLQCVFKNYSVKMPSFLFWKKPKELI